MKNRAFALPIPQLAARMTGAVMALMALSAHAQNTPIKFQLDWRFEGPAALFLTPAAKGYFKANKLDVTVDAGNGSGGAVTRVASGTYDMGFADLASVMEFHANNPDAPNKPVAVMMVYNNTPASVMALKKSGIKTPADLNGKKMGAPVFDAGRRAFPVFAKAAAAIEFVKARDGIINVPLEVRRLRLAIDTVINSPDARAEGFGQVKVPRLTLMASQVSDAFGTKTRVDPAVVWNGSFLPTAAELNVLPVPKK